MHSVTPSVPESVSFYSAWKGKEFCYCLFMFSAPPNGELYPLVFSMYDTGFLLAQAGIEDL